MQTAIFRIETLRTPTHLIVALWMVRFSDSVEE
nr:MAG TPA: hypothetical protein [Caudoviricetes sp.]